MGGSEARVLCQSKFMSKGRGGGKGPGQQHVVCPSCIFGYQAAQLLPVF